MIPSNKKIVLLVQAVVLASTLPSMAGPTDRLKPQATASLPKFRKVSKPITSQYVVTLNWQSAVAAGNASLLTQALSRQYGGTILREYSHALVGFAIRLPASAPVEINAPGKLSLAGLGCVAAARS